jgi:hypothetical protein
MPGVSSKVRSPAARWPSPSRRPADVVAAQRGQTRDDRLDAEADAADCDHAGRDGDEEDEGEQEQDEPPGAAEGAGRLAVEQQGDAPSPAVGSRRAHAASHHAALEARRAAHLHRGAARRADHGQPREPGQGLRRRTAQLHPRDPAAGRARSARALVNENAGLADRHILEATLETKRPLEQRILANDRRIARALAVAAPTFTTAQERKSARFLQHNLATYRSVTSELFGVSRANTPELAYEWSAQRLDPAAVTLSTDLENLYDAKVDESDALAAGAPA